MNLKTALLLIASFLLTACSNIGTMPSKQIKLDPPDSLLQPCALVPELPINATVSDLMQDDLNLIKIYGECQIELKALQKWVTEP